MGLRNAGFEVMGVDITNNHEYPFEFIHSDVFQLEPEFFDQFDLIWASPPCQAYSFGTEGIRNRGKEYPDLVAPTRQLLKDTGKPFIIENVAGAPIRKDIVLCGEMFGLRIVRHRHFEIEGFTVLNPLHEKHKEPLGPIAESIIGRNRSYYAQIAGHGGDSYSYSLKDWQQAIGIDWITKKEHLTQAVPPKYSEYIARYI